MYVCDSSVIFDVVVVLLMRTFLPISHLTHTFSTHELHTSLKKVPLSILQLFFFDLSSVV
jgi:hypothetical protein